MTSAKRAGLSAAASPVTTMPDLLIEVAVDAEAWSVLPDVEALASTMVTLAARHAGVALREGAEVSILLSDDRAIRQLNHLWRHQDKPTNVLSFPAAGPNELANAPMLGDIIIAFETTSMEAARDGKSLADHVAHLVVHGFLHLLGHDHDNDTDADRMEALECAILRACGIADPYAEPTSTMALTSQPRPGHP